MSLQLSESRVNFSFRNLCRDKDLSEPVNFNTQVSRGKQERKGKQLAKQESKKQATHIRLLPASNTKRTHSHLTISAAQSSRASGEQLCGRRSKPHYKSMCCRTQNNSISNSIPNKEPHQSISHDHETKSQSNCRNSC